MRILFSMLLLCNAAYGQNLFPKDSAFVKEVEGLPSKQPFDTARPWNKEDRQYVYIISDKDLYDHFGYDVSMKFYGFDFVHYHILGSLECRQCLEFCHHDKGNKNCHRNLCNNEWIWVVRDNQKAFIEIPSTTMMGHVDADIPENRKYFFGDTVITSKKDRNFSNWYTSGHGDCFATFTYNILADKFHPVLVLKENNYWGGCRAGGGWEFTVSFKSREGIKEYSKNTVLLDKRKSN